MRSTLRKTWYCTAIVAAAAFLAVSCKVGPDYERPSVPMSTTFKSAATQAAGTSPIRQDWWKVYHDPELDTLEEAALKANFTVQAAMARVVEARAAANIVKSGFYPTVTANPSAARAGTPSQTGNAFSLPLDVSYEVDIWGKIRRSYESALAQAQASVADFGVVRLTLTADVAQDYFALRSLDAQDAIISGTIDSYREELRLTQTQLRAGIGSNISVAQAQSLLDSTTTQLQEIRRQRADTEHALAILLGIPPAELAVKAHPLKGEPPAVPGGLPIQLLRQRPDVWEAEQQLVSANAQIGVAKALFYPDLTLTGAAGFQSVDIANILDWQSTFWKIGAGLTQPIFEGGQLQANLQQAKARYDEVLANYRQTLLTAFREVEDELTDLHMRADEDQSQTRAVNASREALRLTRIQYEKGFAIYLQVIDAERTFYTNQLLGEQIREQRMLASVLLIKAMGGGWDPDLPPSTQPTTMPVTQPTKR